MTPAVLVVRQGPLHLNLGCSNDDTHLCKLTKGWPHQVSPVLPPLFASACSPMPGVFPATAHWEISWWVKGPVYPCQGTLVLFKNTPIPPPPTHTQRSSGKRESSFFCPFVAACIHCTSETFSFLWNGIFFSAWGIQCLFIPSQMGSEWGSYRHTFLIQPIYFQ